MSTNDNFNSRKIIEEIENLENDPQNKKARNRKKIFSFFETCILVTLILMLMYFVLCKLDEELEAKFKEEYFYESDYSSSYDDYSDTTEIASNSMTIEDFMNSELGNEFLNGAIQNQVNETENIENEAVVEETEMIEDSTNTIETEEATPVVDEEEVDNYNSEEDLKQEFEEQKKNLVITEAGMSLNNELIVCVENRNIDLLHDLWVYVVFYKANDIVAIDMQEIDILVANNKKYLKVEEMPKKYDRYDVFITKYGYGAFNGTILNDNVTYYSYIENELVEIEIANESSRKVNKIKFTILYYDSNKKLLDFDEVTDYSIRKNGKGEATGYGVWDESLEKYVDYAEYEVLLEYAECYD